MNINDRRSTMSPEVFDMYTAKKLIAKQKNARERGIEFNMSFMAMRNILGAKYCFYTGIPLELPVGDSSNLKPNSLTLDRICSDKGYVKGNVVACSHEFNSMKARVDAAGIHGMLTMVKAFGKAAKRMKSE